MTGQPATEEVWREFSGPLKSWIRRRVRDPADADDVLQDVFVRLHRGLGGLRDRGRLAPWVYRVARSAVVDHLRSRPRGDSFLDRAEPAAPEPEREAERRIAASLALMVGRLPADYREAVRLSEIDGLPQREVARRLGLSLSGAKSRVQRGRRMLRDALLDCCHFEFDRRGGIAGYTTRGDCCRG